MIVKKKFLVQDLVYLLKHFKNWKNNSENETVIAIKSALSNFENEIENITEEKPYEIEDIVEKVLEFNTERNDGGLKLLTPGQIWVDYQFL